MKVFKAFIKPFEAPQRIVKIKILLNFFSSSGIGTGRVNITLDIDLQECLNRQLSLTYAFTYLNNYQISKRKQWRYNVIIINEILTGAIWYHLYNLKNVKNTHRGVLLWLKLTTLLKVTLLHAYFSHFLDCTNSNNLRAKHCKVK